MWKHTWDYLDLCLQSSSIQIFNRDLDSHSWLFVFIVILTPICAV